MEYCVSVWNLQYKGGITKMEKIQNKMSEFLMNGEQMSPDERNLLSNTFSHEERRTRGNLNNTGRCYEFRLRTLFQI